MLMQIVQLLCHCTQYPKCVIKRQLLLFQRNAVLTVHSNIPGAVSGKNALDIADTVAAFRKLPELHLLLIPPDKALHLPLKSFFVCRKQTAVLLPNQMQIFRAKLFQPEIKFVLFSVPANRRIDQTAGSCSDQFLNLHCDLMLGSNGGKGQMCTDWQWHSHGKFLFSKVMILIYDGICKRYSCNSCNV